MHSKKKVTDKINLKNEYKMEIGSTRKKASDYFIYIIIIAVIVQLALLVYRLAQL